MANPGYPPMGPPGGPMQPMGPPGGPMQPMGPPGGPMGPPGGPMGPMGPIGMMPRPPMRQGTSRVVPVVVAAGLAVGVFCGLLFGLGTTKREASAAPSRGSNGATRSDEPFVPESLANPNVKFPDKNAPKTGSNAGSAVAVNAGSAGSADPAAGSAGSAADTAEPTVKSTKLVVEIKPDAVAQTAKILVDGKEIDGATTNIELDPGTTKKKVKVVVKAPTYKDVEQDIEVEGESTTLKLELSRALRSPQAADSASAPPPSRPASTVPSTGNAGASKPAAPPSKPAGNKGKGKGSGGLIDI